jgi:hypothetical protein
MIREVFIEARYLSYNVNPRVAELLDAVENVPDLLCRWPDMNEGWVIGALEEYERKFLNGSEQFSGILKNGPRIGWQTKRHKTPPKNP